MNNPPVNPQTIPAFAQDAIANLDPVVLAQTRSRMDNEESKLLIPQAISAFRSSIGADNVYFDDASRENYAKACLPRCTRPLGIVKPDNADDVSQIVNTCNRSGIRWHTISRGKNWGYGSACAAEDDRLIIDLSRMNRILEVNVELGYAVIEPGVSQGQMYEYLQQHELPLLLDVTGAGPDASIIGNILQRGFGHTPYGDRFRHTCGMHVVLPDGNQLKTGFGRYENAVSSRVFPWGQGPWLDGLFTQSDYGIVTSACIWLMPQPEVIRGFAPRFRRNLVWVPSSIGCAGCGSTAPFAVPYTSPTTCE